jgi:hypothetical protein
MSSYPERLERVVLHALEKAPAERYSTSQELAEELLRTMPPSRGSAPEELQKYMAELLPERLLHHQELIRRALGVHGSAAVPIGGLPKTAHSSNTLRAVSVSDSTSNIPIAEEGGPPISTSTPKTPLPTLRPRRTSTTVVAVAAGAVIGAVAIAAVTGVGRSGAQKASPAAAARSVEPHVAPAIEQSAPASAPALPQSEPAPSASAAAPPVELASPQDGKHPAKKPARLSPAHPRASKESAPPNQGTGLKDPYAQ